MKKIFVLVAVTLLAGAGITYGIVSKADENVNENKDNAKEVISYTMEELPADAELPDNANIIYSDSPVKLVKVDELGRETLLTDSGCDKIYHITKELSENKNYKIIDIRIEEDIEAINQINNTQSDENVISYSGDLNFGIPGTELTCYEDVYFLPYSESGFSGRNDVDNSDSDGTIISTYYILPVEE